MFHVKQLVLLLVCLPTFIMAQNIGTIELADKEIPLFKMENPVVNEFNNRFSEIKAMPIEKQEWFYWTNFSRNFPKAFYDSIISPLLLIFPNLNTSNAKSLKRDLYASKALPMLKPGKKLEEIAQEFANEMAKHKAKPSHTSPSGTTFQSRMQSIGMKYCAGENLSFGPLKTIMMLTFLYIDEGVTGLGHRKTLLDPLFTDMGIGFADYKDKNKIVVQDFSCNQNQ